MTIQEFAQLYKTKNPQFRNMDDLQVAQMVVKAYPEWKEKIDFHGESLDEQPVVQHQTQQAQEKGIIQKAADISGKVLGAGNKFLFGTTGKVVDKMARSVMESGQELLTQKKVASKKGYDVGPGGKVASVGDVAFTALELYPGGGYVSKALRKMPGGKQIAEAFMKIPDKFRAAAVKQYSEALGATTKELKSKTARIAPELLDKGLTGGLNTLEKVSAEGMEKSGQAIKLAEDSISVFKQQAVKPIIERAVKLKSSYIINGKVLDDTAVKSIDNVISSITQFGHQIPETQLVKIKRILDKSVALSNKNFTKEEGLSLAVEAKQGMVNTMRGILNSSNPKLATANKEFSTWANLNKIVSATLERKGSQSSGLTRFIGPILGAGSIGASTGNLTNAIVGYFATDAAIKLFQSAAYKTISAVSKNQLANYLASGQIKKAAILTAKLLNGIKNELSD